MPPSYADFVKLAIQEQSATAADFSRTKKRLSRKLQLPVPSNADLREIYEKMIKEKKLRRDPLFEKILASRHIRTRSGVAVVAVLTKSYPCPGHCLYCPSEKDMPKSYLSNEPAVMRAASVRFDPYAQVQTRLRSLELNGHCTDKIELIVMGGTFSYLPEKYQTSFIEECFRAANDYPKCRGAIYRARTTLEREQKRNEKSRRRIVGLTLETRPDYIDEKEIINFRRLGCTRVELGVQSIFDDVLEKNRRGHSVAATVRATQLLRDAGFKIGYHLMPGLPSSDLERDFEMFRQIFASPDFQPDLLKIYPTVVLRDSALYALWKKGRYQALNDRSFEQFVRRVKKEIIPPYVRISRLVRDVPAESIIAGPIVSNLRQLIQSDSGCRCIRCREVGEDYDRKEKILLDRIDYPAAGGTEIFLQYIISPLLNKDILPPPSGGGRRVRSKSKLLALLRLRIPKSNNAEHSILALRNAALIREVHTYGKMTGLSRKDNLSPQHAGLGKKLIQEAERIARKEFGIEKIAVISGIGAREYYRKLGYRLKDSYMVKHL